MNLAAFLPAPIAAPAPAATVVHHPAGMTKSLRAFWNKSYAKSISHVPPPNGQPIVTISGLLATHDDLLSVVHSSKWGFYQYLYIVAVLLTNGTNFNDNDAIDAALVLLQGKPGFNTEPFDPEASTYDPVAASVGLLLLFTFPGTVGGKKANSLIKAAGTAEPCQNAEEFLAAYSGYSNHKWLGDVASLFFFSSEESVQNFFDGTGELIGEWVAHSAAGSSALQTVHPHDRSWPISSRSSTRF